MRRERPMATLVIGVLVGVVGLVMLLSEAISFAGWIAGNRMLASFAALLISVTLLSTELYRKITVEPSPAPAELPCRLHHNGHQKRRTPSPATPVVDNGPIEPPEVESDTGANLSQAVRLVAPAPSVPGDKSFMSGGSQPPGWAKAQREELRGILGIGPQ